MLEEKKRILDMNVFLNRRKNARLESRFEKSRKLFFLLSILISLAIIAAVYFLSEGSHIYRIAVMDSHYMSDEDVIASSGLTYEDRFLLCNPWKIERRIRENPLIEDCEVTLNDGNLVIIRVQEKKIIGYAYEEGRNVLILEDDSRIEIDKDRLYLIDKVPLIEGFSRDEIIIMEKNLADIGYRMINEISEIHNYPDMKFQNVEIVMRDGNYIFTSVYGLNMIDMYYEMVSRHDASGKHCYYFEDISGNAYTSACPWEEEKQEPKPEEPADIEEEE